MAPAIPSKRGRCWLRGCAASTARTGDWPAGPGQLGREQRLGDGQVGIERFLRKLLEIGYRGPLTIEREVGGEQQMTDFLIAGELLTGLKKKLGVSGRPPAGALVLTVARASGCGPVGLTCAGVPGMRL